MLDRFARLRRIALAAAVLVATIVALPARAVAPGILHDLAFGENDDKVKAISALVASGDPQALPPTLPPQSSQGGAVAGGFARGREGAQPVPSALSPQALEILKGHVFSVRVRFTPVPGM